MSESIPIQLVNEHTLRQLFDDEQILEGVGRGLITAISHSQSPASPRSNQPEGTISELVDYFHGHELIATAHRFVLPDGSIGASGLPDPKMVVSGGTMYLLQI